MSTLKFESGEQLGKPGCLKATKFYDKMRARITNYDSIRLYPLAALVGVLYKHGELLKLAGDLDLNQETTRDTLPEQIPTFPICRTMRT
jgi:hypothetical protein